jgi:hypothetical protein
MHHIKHWANGGETKPSNLVSLCRFHHRAVHEGGFDVRILDDGALRFVRPDGEGVDDIAPGCRQPEGDASRLPVSPGLWRYRGDKLELPVAVDLLIQCAQKAKGVPAGTSP